VIYRLLCSAFSSCSRQDCRSPSSIDRYGTHRTHTNPFKTVNQLNRKNLLLSFHPLRERKNYKNK
jgi:hypothetical protein